MNMKNIFKLSAMMLAAAFVAGCSQNDELDVTPVENEGQLTIHATASDFVSSDATDTRIANDGANTAFEAGDEIGVFAIRSTDNKLMYQNMPLEYLNAESGWTGNENKIYYYKNTAYVAYSPYDDKLNITDATGIEDLQAKIETYFTEKLDAAGNDQSIAYPSLDLMMASAEPADIEGSNDKSLSFNFKHRFALIEIAVPVKAYLDVTKNFTYAEPFSKTFTLNGSEPVNEIKLYPLSLQTSGEAGDTDAKAYNLFRFLVKPDTQYTLSGELEYATPITLNDKIVNLPVGKYMKYTINATNAVSSYTKRDIAVGDYYYADGSIYPGTNDKIITNGCVGIIFATNNVSVNNGIEGSKTYTHGKVLALVNYHADGEPATSGASTSSYYNYWGTHTAGDDVITSASNTEESYASFSGRLDGYAKTTAFASSVDAVQKVLNFGKEINTKYVAPISSTGWYMPSIGELIEVFNAFAVTSNGEGTYSLSASDFANNSANTTNKSATLLNLRNKLVAAGGEFLQEFPEDPTNSSSSNYTDRWWSITEVSNAKTWAIELKTNGQVKVLERDKTGSNKHASIRPILAF